MPKEKTHLFVAERIELLLKDKKLQALLQRNRIYYLLGAIIPDCCYYSNPTKKIAENLHGKNGNLTNFLVFQLLEQYKKNKLKEPERAERDLALACGYLAHCALDSVFHPVINYFTGFYYNKENKENSRAVYLHRHFETYLDQKLKLPFKVGKMFSAKLLAETSFASLIAVKFNISAQKVQTSFQEQLKRNRQFDSFAWYALVSLVSHLGILNKKDRASFYPHLYFDLTVLPENLLYCDSFTGERPLPEFCSTARK